MSASHENTEPTDQVSELPGGPAIAGHYVNAVLHNTHHHLDDSDHPPASPSSNHPPVSYPYNVDAGAASRVPNRPRASSTSSHVPLDYFDREGVQELKRSLTSQSNALARAAEQANSQGAQLTPPVPSSSSQTTAVSGQDAFDLEKHLRNVVSK